MLSGAFCFRMSVIDELKPTGHTRSPLWSSPHLQIFLLGRDKRSVITASEEMS
jgi:hypothetical protein